MHFYQLCTGQIVPDPDDGLWDLECWQYSTEYVEGPQTEDHPRY